MLRAFGVEKVSILAGGLEGWRRDELPLEQGVPEVDEGNSTCASILSKLSA